MVIKPIGVLLVCICVANVAFAEKYFSNCTALRAVYPNGVPIGHPSYRKALDRDNDGCACESKAEVCAQPKKVVSARVVEIYPWHQGSVQICFGGGERSLEMIAPHPAAHK